MSDVGKRDVEVWNRYASDEDEVAALAAAIKEGQGLPTVPIAKPRSAVVKNVKVETQNVETFSVPSSRGERMAKRSEHILLKAFERHLELKGHLVTGREYQPPNTVSSLYCDLVDESDGVLYEAKGNGRRESVRMAIGQLLDYRRFESSSMKLAVLLPRRPNQDLINLIHSVPASVVWRTQGGFKTKKSPIANV